MVYNYRRFISYSFGIWRVKKKKNQSRSGHAWCLMRDPVQLFPVRWRVLVSCDRRLRKIRVTLTRPALPMCFLLVACHEMLMVLPFPFLHSKDLVGTICPTLVCEYPRKYLFTDLDGRTLGLPPPVSVFPRTEEEWTGSFLNTGGFCLTTMCVGKVAIVWKGWWPCCSMRTKYTGQAPTSKAGWSLCWCATGSHV